MKNPFAPNIGQILRNAWLTLTESMLSCMWTVSYSIVTSNNSWACCRGSWGLGGCCRWCLRRRSRTLMCITRFTLWTFSDTVSPESFLGRVVTRSRSSWCSGAAWFGTITPYRPWRKPTVSILQSGRKAMYFNLSICLNNFFFTLGLAMYYESLW